MRLQCKRHSTKAQQYRRFRRPQPHRLTVQRSAVAVLLMAVATVIVPNIATVAIQVVMPVAAAALVGATHIQPPYPA